ncbi:MAG TPA: thioredoxin domain-containing protein [Nitrospiraceae bacterium]|nr:thioredoxin domain-containing protein [Nitrospiraceae bacterium]
MNRRTLVVSTIVVTVAVFTAAAAYYPDMIGSRQEESNLVRAHSPTFGPADAPVTIVEFLDPSCETCRAFYPIVKQIMGDFPTETRLVIRYAPVHEGSDEAVRILEAARLQDKFTPVLEKLFLEQPQWAAHDAPNVEMAWSFAGDVGLDLDKARRDAQSQSIASVLEQDIADMKAANVRGTPTFFVNGKPLPSFGAPQLYELVASEVAIARGTKSTQ